MANQQGWNEQTPAIKSLLSGALGTARRVASGGKRRRKKAARASGAKRSTRTKKRATRTKSKAKRLVAGSAAAKAWGRKMKRLRKK